MLGEKDDVVLSVQHKAYEVGGKVVRRAGVTVSVTEATMAARAATGEDADAADAEGEEEAAATEEEEDEEE